MVFALRVVASLLFVLGLVGAAIAAGFHAVQWLHHGLWEQDVLLLALFASALAIAGMITLALLSIRDAVSASSRPIESSVKPAPGAKGTDVRTSYLDIRER
jgi:hypothetical protein